MKNVRDFGATGNGTTNDTSAFVNAVSALANGETLLVPDGRYLIDPVTIAKTCRVQMETGATLIANSLTSELGLIAFQGSEGAGTTLGASATRGALFVKVASIAPFAAGDWIRIKDDAAPATAFEYEFARVRAVQTPDILRLTWPLELPVTYPSGLNGLVTKINMLEGCEFVGGAIDGNSLGGTNVSLVSQQYCVEGIVRDCILTNYDYVGIDVNSCVFTRIDGVQVYDSSADLAAAAPPNAGYGVMLRNSAAHTTVTGSRFRQMRHAVDVEQGAHHVAVTHCDVAGSFSSVIQTHMRRALQIVFANNVISGHTYRSNTTFTESPVSYGLRLDTTDTNAVIVGNVVLGVLGPGVSVVADASEDGYVVVSDNVITDCVPTDVSLASLSVIKKRHVLLSGNKIIRRDTTSSAGIRVENCDDVQVMGNDVDFQTTFGASANAGAIYVLDSRRVVLQGNSAQINIGSGQAYRIGSSAAGAADDVTLVGNAANVGGGAVPYLVSAAATHVRQSLNTWSPTSGVSADRGNANVTLTMQDEETQRFATALTANRTVTLPTTGGYRGARFRIVRTGLGAFTLIVAPSIKTIPASTAAFVDAEHDGTTWRLTGYGTL